MIFLRTILQFVDNPVRSSTFQQQNIQQLTDVKTWSFWKTLEILASNSWLLDTSVGPILLSSSQRPTSKKISPMPIPLPNASSKAHPIPTDSQRFSGKTGQTHNKFYHFRCYTSQSLNFRFRALTSSSVLALKDLKSPFKWLNNRNSNISSLNNVGPVVTVGASLA